MNMSVIVLIGFKSSGKSSTGKALAERLHLPFLDTDTLLEDLHAERCGEHLSCREIYARYGSSAMREMEADALRQALAGKAAVIATGGGIVLHEANRKLLKAMGGCVFLDTPLPMLEQRLKAHANSPLFREKGVAQVHAERHALYGDIATLRIVPQADETPEDVARRIANSLQENVHGQ